METVAYACYNKDDKIREKSSSGAVFFELAKWIISQNGIVFGAKFDKQWNVVHSHADTLEGVMNFLGSKYVQSSIGDEYKIAKEYLDNGKLVLFSGTPCQISGLLSYLKKEYENLITVDLICHGVPSKAVWREYVNEIAADKHIKNINFRNKTEGWLDFSLRVDFTDKTNYRQNQHNDIYIKGFLSDLYLRPSCYKCKFKGIERNSDITLADYWGVKNIIADMFDDKGTSLIMIHTEKGKDICNSVKNKFNWQKTDLNAALKNNPNAIKSAGKNTRRNAFFNTKQYNSKNIVVYTRKTFAQKSKIRIKSIIKKIIGRK